VPQVGQVRWGSALMDLTALQSQPQPAAIPRSHKVVRNCLAALDNAGGGERPHIPATRYGLTAVASVAGIGTSYQSPRL